MASMKQSFREVTKELNAFVRSFDEEYSCVLGSSFEAHINENTIHYSIAFGEKAGVAFYDNFISRFPKCKSLSLFCLSFLHELGHLETEYDMVDDIKAREKVKTYEEYFNLYNERIATDWAGNYATKHLKEMKIFDKKISEKMEKVLDTLLDK